jgi:hypothetical protein
MRVAIATFLCALSLGPCGSAQLRGVAAENIDRTKSWRHSYLLTAP